MNVRPPIPVLTPISLFNSNNEKCPTPHCKILTGKEIGMIIEFFGGNKESFSSVEFILFIDGMGVISSLNEMGAGKKLKVNPST